MARPVRDRKGRINLHDNDELEKLLCPTPYGCLARPPGQSLVHGPARVFRVSECAVQWDRVVRARGKATKARWSEVKHELASIPPPRLPRVGSIGLSAPLCVRALRPLVDTGNRGCLAPSWRRQLLAFGCRHTRQYPPKVDQGKVIIAEPTRGRNSVAALLGDELVTLYCCTYASTTPGRAPVVDFLDPQTIKPRSDEHVSSSGCSRYGMAPLSVGRNF